MTRPAPSRARSVTAHPEADPCAGLLGGVDQQGVEDGTTRRVERVHAGGRLQHDRHRFVAVVERHPPHRRRAACRHPVQQAPAPQLQDAAAHERMGGQGVRAAAGAVHDQHPQAGPGEQQGGRRACDARADDDGVPAGVGAAAGGGGGSARSCQGVLTSIWTSVPLASTS